MVSTHLFAGLGELADDAGGDLDRAHAADLAIAIGRARRRRSWCGVENLQAANKTFAVQLEAHERALTGQVDGMELRNISPFATDFDAVIVASFDEAFDLVADVTVLRGDDHHVARWF